MLVYILKSDKTVGVYKQSADGYKDCMTEH